MSSELILYLLKGSLTWCVLYVLYYGLYRKNHFHKLNRFILLSILICSLVFPLIRVEYEFVEPVVPSFAEKSMELMAPLQSGTEVIEASGGNNILWQIGVGIYFLGAFIAVIRLILRFRFLLQVTQHANSLRRESVNLFETRHPAAPFSFFNYIYVPSGMEEDQLQIILLHEGAHIRQYHSLDILLLEIYTIIFWFNPLLGGYRKSLQQLHEYMADAEVLSKGVSLSTYLSLLQRNIQNRYEVELVQAFFQSTIINRIHMMTSNKQSGWWKVSYTFFLPVLAAFYAGLYYSS